MFMTITATLDKNWRDDCFGKSDFEKLEYFLMMAYHVCKDIDSTEWSEHWPDEIRGYIADAYNLIQEWNRSNYIKDNNPSFSDVNFAFQPYRNEKFSPMYGCIMK
jgi:hypothetical protein